MPLVGVVGGGAWGSNLIRVFHELGALTWICELDRARLEELGRRYAGVRLTSRVEDLLADPDLRALVVATPAGFHAALARQALAAGKDVFIEKPLALSYDEGRAVVEAAAARQAVLMVGHVLQYHPAVVKLKALVDGGELGDLYYLYSSRTNLGRVRQEENILWSFAPHDISVMLLLVGELPTSVSVSGGTYLQRGVADVTVSTYSFASGVQGHIFVSWLHPFKEQRLVVVGSRKMAVFDDVATDRKLVLYDKGVTWRAGLPVPRSAPEHVIPLSDDEPLRVECVHFLDCVARRLTPRTDGREGLRVLQVLEASQRSLVEGRPVAVTPQPVAADG